MNGGQPKTQPAAQAGSPGEAVRVGLEVGGVHSNDGRPRPSPRDAACPHARRRSEELGDGSQEITTPAKLRQLQRALYRKAKADRTPECFAMKRLGKPDTGNPSVRFDEGSEPDGHWRTPFTPSAPAYSTTGFQAVRTVAGRLRPVENCISLCRKTHWKIWVMLGPQEEREKTLAAWSIEQARWLNGLTSFSHETLTDAVGSCGLSSEDLRS